MFKAKYFIVILSVLLATGSAWSATNAKHAVKKNAQATEQYISDAAITAKVKAELLASLEMKVLSISVTTDNGVVTLSGTVDNSIQNEQAVKIASHVNGVKSVKNEIVVRAG